MAVGVLAAAAVVADLVCADAVAVWSWEGRVPVLACVAVGALSLALVVARLEAVWLRLLATLAVPPEPHAAKVNTERPNTPIWKVQRVTILLRRL